MSYVICTDSAADVSEELLRKWGVVYRQLTYRFDGEDHEYNNFDIPVKEFYGMMRDGKVARTAAMNMDCAADMFREIAAKGEDILYIAFSSGLSSTYHTATLAAQEVMEEYPDRKILVVDSRCASTGQGLLVYLTVQQKNAGASLEEAAKFAEDIRPKICHWFTVDDLVYLKRGGRISAATALVGGLLGIKPILHVDDEGHLISMGKVRGRKASITAIVDKYGELADTKDSGTIFICNGDCIEDANTLAAMVKERYGAEVQLISDTGPVIGAHSGPGTLALFFVGSHR